MLTNGVTIISDTGASYHSFNDFGLAIGNTDYIKEPEYETHYVEILGRNGFIDLSETVSGRVIYKEREISIEFGGMNPEAQWDNVISNMRNLFHGRQVQLIFDNDPNWYWTGRAEINEFDRFRNMGTFTLDIPKADPFKYSITEEVLGGYALEYGSPTTVAVPVTAQPVEPTFIVSNYSASSSSNSISVEVQTAAGGRVSLNYIYANGVYRLPNVFVEKGNRIVLTGYVSTATVQIKYRQVSL